MGGKIWVKSKEKQGSTFYFTIKTKVSKVVPPKVFLKSSTPALKNKRVLIVDDNETNLHILTLQCKNWGMMPRTTRNPKDAVKWIINNDPFDIAILDMLMPDMDGLELTKEIRKYRDKKSLPVVILSSGGSQDIDKKEINEYLNAIVSKPIKQAQLYKMLMSILGPTIDATEKKKEKEVYQTNQETKPNKKRLSEEIPLKVLVAEDNIINQKLIVKILSQLGYQSDVVSNGIEAIDELKRVRYDLVFMDVQMPEMDGIEATKYIVQNWNSEERPFIIAMTANVLQGDKEKCINAGMDDYLSKPVIIDDVQNIIKKWSENLKARKTESRNIKSSLMLDSEIIFGLKQLNESSNFKEVISLYMELAPELISEIKKSFKSNNLPAIKKASSNLRRISHNLGANRLAEVCIMVESLNGNNTREELESLIDRLDNIYKLTHDELKKI